MQTKTSYRVVKWMFLAGMACSMATACVVSSGDGDDDDTDFDDGGDGGTNTTAGKTSTGGGGSGGSSGGSKADGGMPMTDGGEPNMTTGGTPSTFVPGECEGDAPLEPTSLPSCDPATTEDACFKCVMADQASCEAFQKCFGEEPSTACGVGQTEGADGEFACIRACFAANEAGEVDPDMLLYGCVSDCSLCESGLPNTETDALVEFANSDTCRDECFPFE